MKCFCIRTFWDTLYQCVIDPPNIDKAASKYWNTLHKWKIRAQWSSISYASGSSRQVDRISDWFCHFSASQSNSIYGEYAGLFSSKILFLLRYTRFWISFKISKNMIVLIISFRLWYEPYGITFDIQFFFHIPFKLKKYQNL